ncbi:MAG: hypothetical protein JW778_08280 [Candidatus Altiarchaeota archaeon]|nr:hypothetical protein [Candidatus Altiarchaeota archaeon]
MKSRRENFEVKIGVPRESPQNIEELLTQLFWKEPELVDDAREFLEHVKEWSRSGAPYTTAEWKNYCIRGGISQSRYHNMLKRLKNSGMIEKVYNKGRKAHEVRLVDRFSETLSKMAEVWDNYLRL